MRIAVLGAGAMGCLYGGLLAEKGNDVVFIDVVDSTIKKINSSGVTLETDSRKRDIPAKACKAAELTELPEVVFLFTKTVYSRAALDSVRHLLNKNVTIVTIQNGLGNKELIEEYVAENQVIIGMTGYPADLRGPADVASHGTSFTAIVCADGSVSEIARAIAEKVTEAGLNCTATPDALRLIWEKVSFNAAINSVCATTGMTVGEVGELGGRQLTYDLAAEGTAVAAAYGISAEFDKVKEMLDHAFAGHYNHKPSMLQDVLNNRLTEVNSLNGALVTMGKAKNVPTPANYIMYQLVVMKQNMYPKK